MILVSTKGLAAPRTSVDVLDRLEQAGALLPGSAAHYRPIVGFRNRVMHLYDRIDPDIVYRILTEDRGDLRELLDRLLEAADE